VHVSLAVALVAFALGGGLLGWRLWVGVPGRARVVVIGSFVIAAVDACKRDCLPRSRRRFALRDVPCHAHACALVVREDR
jgi:hypothetical protein